MRILGVITGRYGERHVSNVREHAPEGWTIEEWRAPTQFPIVVDYPDEYVPSDLPEADLILSFPEVVAVGQTLYNQTGSTIPVVILWMVFYVSVSLVISAIVNWYNRRLQLVER